MKLGRICLIKRREDDVEIGWYQRLYGDGNIAGGGNIAYYCIMSTAQDAPKMIDNSNVGERYAGRNALSRYYIDIVMPLEVQVEHTFLDDPHAATSEAVRERMLSDIVAEINRIEHQLRRDLPQDRRDAYVRRQKDMRAIANKIDPSMEYQELPLFCYAYGVHPNFPKEYCWRIPSDMPVASVGQHLIGMTSKGAKPFTVTRIACSRRLTCTEDVIEDAETAKANEEKMVENLMDILGA